MNRSNTNTRLLYHRLGVHTIEETAQHLGISRQRVMQIEARALEKLRKNLRIKYGITSVADIL